MLPTAELILRFGSYWNRQETTERRPRRGNEAWARHVAANVFYWLAVVVRRKRDGERHMRTRSASVISPLLSHWLYLI